MLVSDVMNVVVLEAGGGQRYSYCPLNVNRTSVYLYQFSSVTLVTGSQSLFVIVVGLLRLQPNFKTFVFAWH
jgi:hypothetical protein